MRITVLGFTIPDPALRELLKSDLGMPIQTHTFAWNLVRALTASGAEVTLLSATPASTFPHNRKIVFRGGNFQAEQVHGRMLGFVNILLLKHLTRLLACLRGGRKAIAYWGSRVLLIHGVHSPFLWFGIAARKLFGIKVFPVLTDPPGVVLPTDGGISSTLKKLDIWVVKSALRRCDGVIALTPRLAADFAPGVPALVMEGFFEDPAVAPRTLVSGREGPRDIVYAGGLTRAYGVDRLVEAVRGISEPDVRLCLYGRGELEGWIAEQARVDPRIKSPEFVDRSALQERLRQAHVLVNPRPVGESFVKYSFPSKMMEYLAARVPIVTTRLPGIPPDYEPFVFFADTDDVDGLRTSIEKVLKLDAAEAVSFGASAFDFARTTRSREGQGVRIIDFVARC